MTVTIAHGLHTLLAVGELPAAALAAAATHPELLTSIAARHRLPSAVITRAFTPGRPPDTALAVQLVDRRLPQPATAHVLGVAGERRPTVLHALLAHNVPAATTRKELLRGAPEDPRLVASILANPRWPLTEQRQLLRHADGPEVLTWLANLDPEVEITWDDLDGAGSRTRLDGDPVVALHALVRHPWLTDLPFGRAGPGFRAALATVTADQRTLYRLLGNAQRLAGRGRRDRAAQLIEAVACNPAATLAVQRRARRLARRIDCPYLHGWLPATAAPATPLWEAPPDLQRAAMDRLEQLTRIRHRTVFSAALLAANPQLTTDVAGRLLDYLDAHLHAVDIDGSLAQLLGNRLKATPATTRRWANNRRRKPCAHPAQPTRPTRAEEPKAGEVHLDDCDDPALARRQARNLTRQFGSDPDRWELTWLLLRDGFELPLHDLPAIIDQLQPDRQRHAA